MSGSIKRTGAIFIKELQEIKSNVNVLCMYLLPVLILVIYKGFIKDIPLSMLISMSLVMLVGEVCVFTPAMLIAEEKEKKTLNTLLLSPASPTEVFAGKGLITLLSVMVMAMLISLMAGAKPEHIGVILVGTILSTIACSLLGMIVGLYAKTQMATGMLALPLILPFIMLPLLTLTGNPAIEKISVIVPTYHYFRMINLSVDKQQGLFQMLPEMGALALIIVISFGLLVLIYKKRGFEN